MGDPIFKKKGPVPPSVLRLLTVKNGGEDISEKLRQWKAKISDSPYAATVITVTNTTGRITASRVVVRGPIFSASGANRVSSFCWTGRPCTSEVMKR